MGGKPSAVPATAIPAASGRAITAGDRARVKATAKAYKSSVAIPDQSRGGRLIPRCSSAEIICCSGRSLAGCDCGHGEAITERFRAKCSGPFAAQKFEKVVYR